MDKKLCEVVTKTYNTYKLKSNKEDEFIKVITEFVNNNKGKVSKELLYSCNFTLIKLFYNRFFKHIPVFKNVVGPCSLSLYKSDKYNKTVYVFGEYHCDNKNIDTKCQKSLKYETISNLMSTCSENSPVFLDIFLEFPRTARSLSGNGFPGGIIGDIASYKNIPCFNNPNLNNRIFNDNCSTTRWHYTDIRFDKFYRQTSLAGHIYYELDDSLELIKSDNEISWEKLNFKDLCSIAINDKELQNFLNKRKPIVIEKEYAVPRTEKLTEYLIKVKAINPNSYTYTLILYYIFIIYNPEMLKFYKSFMKDDVEQIRNWFWNQFSNYDSNKLLVKEINKSYESDKILNFMNTYIINTTKDKMDVLKTLSRKIDMLNFQSVKSFFNSMDNLREYIGNVGCIFTDAYLLARIFKKFKLNINHDMPETPTNIITYGGEKHADNLRKFFEFGIDSFDKLAESYNESCPLDSGRNYEYMCCLNLEKFPQPFFNKEVSS